MKIFVIKMPRPLSTLLRAIFRGRRSGRDEA